MNNKPISVPGGKKIVPGALGTLQSFYEKPVAQVSLELIATIIAVILLGALAIRPTLSSISRLLTDIEERRETNQALIRKEAALSTVSQDVLRLRPQLNLLEKTLPSTPDLSGALRRIEKIASETILPITQLRVEVIPRETTSAPNPKPEYQAISIRFSGSYEAVERFLNELENQDRTSRIKQIALEAPKDRTTQNIDVLAELEIFHFGAPVSMQEETPAVYPPERTQL